jgi:hypothetical protein
MMDEAIARREIDSGLPFLLADELADIRRRFGFHRLHRGPNPLPVALRPSLDRAGGGDNKNDSPLWLARDLSGLCSS